MPVVYTTSPHDGDSGRQKVLSSLSALTHRIGRCRRIAAGVVRLGRGGWCGRCGVSGEGTARAKGNRRSAARCARIPPCSDAVRRAGRCRHRRRRVEAVDEVHIGVTGGLTARTTTSNIWRPRLPVREPTAREAGRSTACRGLFHWTGVDNYERNHGYDVSFGLIDRQRRVCARVPGSLRPKPSRDPCADVAVRPPSG
jgi:hypothetical protein